MAYQKREKITTRQWSFDKQYLYVTGLKITSQLPLVYIMDFYFIVTDANRKP